MTYLYQAILYTIIFGVVGAGVGVGVASWFLGGRQKNNGP